jgi:molybdopterin/thiamine biosynthesis adenylyltransferase
MNNFYKLITSRNLGLIDQADQEKIRNTKVALCGLGGIGSPTGEMLIRMGVGEFSLVDHGKFEPSNSNRQIYSFTDTDGKWKTEVTEEYFRKINPEVIVRKYNSVNELNVKNILDNVDIVILAIDSLIPILLLSREAHLKKIPLIEAWAFAYGNVRVFTHETPTLEEVYGLPTTSRQTNEIDLDEQTKLLSKSIFDSAATFPGLMDHYSEPAILKMKEEGTGTTLAPLVWFTSSLIAIEVTKWILNRGELALAPAFRGFDPFTFRAF